MSPGLYRKKPVVVEAIQWTEENVDAVGEFIGGFEDIDHMVWPSTLVIETLEGDMTAQPEDWIIKGVAGEFYPCREDIFAATYESVLPDANR